VHFFRFLNFFLGCTTSPLKGPLTGGLAAWFLAELAEQPRDAERAEVMFYGR
jgi:hypothetical protein